MIPLSKAKLKHFSALRQSKFRREYGLFVADGAKLYEEAQKARAEIEAVIATAAAVEKYGLTRVDFLADAKDMERLSDQPSPEGVVTVLSLPRRAYSEPIAAPALALAGVNDPANLGALLRVADWFGFAAVYASPQTVDAFNPKTVRAAMGAVFRIPVYVTPDFDAFLQQYQHRIAAAAMHGAPLHTANLAGRDILLLGNETHGLESIIQPLPNILPVHIPRKGQAESLNVSVAAGILAYAMAADK